MTLKEQRPVRSARCTARPLNMVRMAVGVTRMELLERALMPRAGASVYSLQTRNFPKRVDELDGGSLYWVFGGHIRARSLFREIWQGERPDGTKTAVLDLLPPLIATELRPMKAFQGWRYLAAEDAPADIKHTDATLDDDMPDHIKAALMDAGLL